MCDKFRNETIIHALEGSYLTYSPLDAENVFTSVDSSGFSQLPISFAMKMSKIIFIGDVNTGKTSVIRRFTHDCFRNDYKATIGVDFHMVLFKILTMPFSLQIWDTAGQERFRSIAGSYYRNSHAIVVVFDATEENSLRNCGTWMSEAVKNNLGKPFRFLVANKMDNMDREKWDNVRNKAEEIAHQLEAEFWAISAKTGENVVRLFRRIACLCFGQVCYESRDLLRVSLGTGDDLKKTTKTSCSGHQCK